MKLSRILFMAWGLYMTALLFLSIFKDAGLPPGAETPAIFYDLIMYGLSVLPFLVSVLIFQLLKHKDV